MNTRYGPTIGPNRAAVGPQVHPNELAFSDGSIGVLAVSADELKKFAANPLSVDSDPAISIFGNMLAPQE